MAAVAVACIVAVPVLAQTISERRESAVLNARAGHMADAINALRALLGSPQDDGRVAFDLTAFLQQDGKSLEAATVFARVPPATAPDYALVAATRANRSIGRYAESEALAREGAQRFPADPLWPLLLSLILSDAGRGGEALQILQTPLASKAPRVEWLLARAYAHRRSNEPFPALRDYAEASRLAPGNKDAQRGTADVLSELGGPYGAGRIAPVTSSTATSQAAAMVRWGEDVKAQDPVRRFDGTDRAIARLDALLQDTNEPALRRRLRLDRVIALRDRFRMDEVVTEAEALKAEAPLPGYADEAYADALLYLRHPREAREGYERVLAQDPKSANARYGQFYASIELEDFTAAYAAVDALLRDEPIWRAYAGDPTRYPNPERTTVEVTAAKGRLYADQLGEAWERISQLADAAPANADVRLTRAQVAAARGWPRLAREEAEIAAGLAPDEPGEKIALAEAAAAEHRYGEADRLVRELVALYPEDRAVQRLAQALDAEHRWLLTLEVKPSFNSGGGANATGQEMESSARLYTEPIADHWRLFALDDYSFAHPLEGFVWRERAGAGVDLRLPHLSASLFADQSWGTLNKAGGGAIVDWAVTDQMSLGASAEFFTLDTPLRALFYGITADEYAVRATYRWHESRSIAVTAAYQPFTDGNQRFAGGIAYEERLLSLPHFALTGLADITASTNSLGSTTPYFNPPADLTVTGGARAEHVLWKRYDHSLTQVLQANAGLYEERGFADSWVGTVSYEHRWRFAPLTEFRYGVQASRRVYDGAEELGLAITLGLRQRL